MNSSDTELSVSEYRIKYYHIGSELNVHTRYFQSVNVEQLKKNLPQIIGDKEYELVSIEKYNRYAKKWELQ